MKKFIIKLAVYCLLLLAIMASIVLFDFLVVKGQYETNYMASFLDKMERLESIKEPKIVLVGHSNVAFGFRSELIEKEFGMPVVNLGLHGSLGNMFHEEMVWKSVNVGDIIVVCHSTYADNGIITDKGLLWITFEKHLEYWWMLTSIKEKMEMVYNCPYYCMSSLLLYATKQGNKPIDSAYSRSAFNEYGDNVWADTHEERYVFSKGSISVPGINDICVNRLNALNEFVTGKDALLLIAGYPIGDGEFTPPHEEFKKYEQELKSRLEIPVISNVEDYFFDYKYFYDTDLHLNAEGAVIRTEQLIKDLKNFLAQ